MAQHRAAHTGVTPEVNKYHLHHCLASLGFAGGSRALASHQVCASFRLHLRHSIPQLACRQSQEL